MKPRQSRPDQKKKRGIKITAGVVIAAVLVLLAVFGFNIFGDQSADTKSDKDYSTENERVEKDATVVECYNNGPKGYEGID